MMLPQLQRDQREVEEDLRLARHRLAWYELRQQTDLAADARRVVEGLERLHATLTTQIHAFYVTALSSATTS